jgi:hypothetical protein
VIAGLEPANLDAATSEFFVSRASVIDAKPSPIVRIEGAHPLRLAMLESVLTAGGIVQAVMWAARPDIDGGPRGPWVTPLSDELTEGLAGLGGFDDVHQVAGRWLEAGTWETKPGLRDELTVGLLLLAHLSRDARRIQGRVWCWTELPSDAPTRPTRRWGRNFSKRVFRGFLSDRKV